jgi:hypothetical protein
MRFEEVITIALIAITGGVFMAFATFNMWRYLVY